MMNGWLKDSILNIVLVLGHCEMMLTLFDGEVS